MRKQIKQSKRFAVFNRDNHTCQYCGKKAPGVVLEIDHKIPVSKGGDNSMGNLVTSCFDCNRGKSDKHLIENRPINEFEAKISALNICSMMHFKQKESFIDRNLSRQIIIDLFTKCNLDISEVMIAIASCKNPQDFFKHCLDNYYYGLMKE